MLRPLIALFGVLACSLAATADGDAVAKKLQAAKDDYDAKIEKAEAAIVKWFDKREETARKAGDKKALDQVKADRAAFSEYETLPGTTPADLRKQFASARTAYEAAMLAAIKDFTKLKRDEDAVAIEKALRDFRMRDWKQVDTSKATFKDDYFRLEPNRSVSTRQQFGGFELTIVARTEAENIRLHAQRGSCVIFNWEGNPRAGHARRALFDRPARRRRTDDQIRRRGTLAERRRARVERRRDGSLREDVPPTHGRPARNGRSHGEPDAGADRGLRPRTRQHRGGQAGRFARARPRTERPHGLP